MSEVTKPIALDETFNTTESTPRNLADVLASGLANIANNVKPDGSDISIDVPGMSATNVDDGFSELKGTLTNNNNTSLLNDDNKLIALDTTKYPSGVTNHTTGISRYTKIGSVVCLFLNLKSTTTGTGLTFNNILPTGFRPLDAPNNFVISDGGITGQSLVNVSNSGTLTIYFGSTGFAQGVIAFPAFA